MRNLLSKKTFILCFLPFLGAVASAQAFSFEQIQNWTGSGANEAAYVVDWHSDNTEPMVWGYRWDGEATGEDMLKAVVTADPNLYALISGQTSYGIALFGLGYDLDGDGFGLNGFTPDSQGFFTGGYGNVDGVLPEDTDDIFASGWYDSFWSYWLSTETRLDAQDSDWSFSGLGMTSRTLASGDVDGWGFDEDMDAYFGGGDGIHKPTGPYSSAPQSAVPIPGSLFLLGGGLMGLVRIRHKKAV
jgi:hypothetical protein